MKCSVYIRNRVPLFTEGMLLMGLVMIGCRSSETAKENVQPASTAMTQAEPEPVPFQDLETAEVLKLNQRWIGDFDEIAERRFIRALVPNSRTLYYLDGAAQRGLAFESLREFEKELAAHFKGRVAPKIVIIPTSRDRLLPALVEGYGDIAIGGFTVTEARKVDVDFSVPTMEGIRHLVVTGPNAPALVTLDDLAGKEVHVRPASSYHEDLAALNERFAQAGKPVVVIRAADEMLEDEDLLQMVDAAIIPITLVKENVAEFWAQIYDSLDVHENLALRTGGQLAWALRKNTPKLMEVVNGFVRTHRAGTTFGNVLLKRYLGSAQRLRNPKVEEELRRFKTTAQFFRKYADQYDFDWLVLAAQAYQESRLDQNLRSHVGAIGVMQVMPGTAEHMGIRDIEKLENNIHAGVKYLRFIVDEYYKDEPMDRLNRACFAFASYNAGPTRISKLRKKAAETGLDPNRWLNNVELIAARQIGRETVDYVSNIYKYYTVYKSIVDEEADVKNVSADKTTDRK
jgi:membrane-bound lytic murein transglycosylase MltF